jgi:type 1 fimbriae regulatory protein FimB/type 1 fimbriae regulatory protein FimE
MAATHDLKVVGPASKKCAVALPVRRPNAVYRSREHLTEREVERLIDAAKDNRWGHRDATMVLLAFRHGLRASELVDLRWEQVDLENAILHVRRVKQGTPATHPLGAAVAAFQRRHTLLGWLRRRRSFSGSFCRKVSISLR